MSEPVQRPSDAEWLTEADIIRAAKVVIWLRGTAAYDRARHRVGDLRLTGDHEAAESWLRVAKTIERLQAKARALCGRWSPTGEVAGFDGSDAQTNQAVTGSSRLGFLGSGLGVVGWPALYSLSCGASSPP